MEYEIIYNWPSIYRILMNIVKDASKLLDLLNTAKIIGHIITYKCLKGEEEEVRRLGHICYDIDKPETFINTIKKYLELKEEAEKSELCKDLIIRRPNVGLLKATQALEDIVGDKYEVIVITSPTLEELMEYIRNLAIRTRLIMEIER